MWCEWTWWMICKCWTESIHRRKLNNTTPNTEWLAIFRTCASLKANLVSWIHSSWIKWTIHTYIQIILKINSQIIFQSYSWFSWIHWKLAVECRYILCIYMNLRNFWIQMLSTTIPYIYSYNLLSVYTYICASSEHSVNETINSMHIH